MITAFKRVVARHWPVLRFRTIILGILLFVAALPGIGAVFLRVYENALVRRTEAELVAQSAVLAASAEMIWPGAHRVAQPAPPLTTGRYEEAATEVDLQSAAILPERPAPMRAHPSIDATALFVARTMAPAMAQTKQVTLASIQLLDRSGVVLNGYGAGGSLSRVPEVAAALRGEPVTVLRRVNRRANGTPYRRAKGTPFHDGARLIGHAPLRCARRREGGARPEARAAQSIF